MAKLIPQGTDNPATLMLLRLGTNRIGRGEHNDFPVDHATVSALHCELILGGDSLHVRDLGSTNGTFVDGVKVKEQQLRSGQQLRLGSLEFTIELSEVQVFIPPAQEPVVPPKLRTQEGKSVCLHHDDRAAVWKCTRCQFQFCTPCIHRLRRSGGRVLYLCPECSGVCEVLPEFAKQDKRTWFGFVKDKLHVTRLLRRTRHRR